MSNRDPYSDSATLRYVPPLALSFSLRKSARRLDASHKRGGLPCFRSLPVLQCCVTLVTAGCSFAVASPSRDQRTAASPARYAQEQTAQVESVSGRITSVEGNSSTLKAPQSQGPGARDFQQDARKVMTFTVDQNSTVEGKIEVGAKADVTYRVQDGNNIAVSVRGAPPQT